MSSVSRKPAAAGSPTPKAIINRQSPGGIDLNAFPGSDYLLNTPAQRLDSGALTANTLKQLINITGGGSIKFLRVQVNDVTSRTVRCKLTLDGVVVFDATSTANTNPYAAMELVGTLIQTPTTTPTLNFDDLPFRSSCVFEVASSLTETNKLSAFFACVTW